MSTFEVSRPSGAIEEQGCLFSSWDEVYYTMVSNGAAPPEGVCVGMDNSGTMVRLWVDPAEHEHNDADRAWERVIDRIRKNTPRYKEKSRRRYEERMRTDPEFRAKVQASLKAFREKYYAENPKYDPERGRAYRERRKLDPEWVEKRRRQIQEYRERVKDDPEYKARHRAAQKRYRDKMKLDPVWLEAHRERNRQYRKRFRLNKNANASA